MDGIGARLFEVIFSPPNLKMPFLREEDDAAAVDFGSLSTDSTGEMRF